MAAGDTVLTGPIAEVNTNEGVLVEPAAQFLLPQKGRLYSEALPKIFSTQGDGSGRFDMTKDGVAITAATNATPIVITAAGHGMSEGDRITIVLAAGNTGANGIWKATSISGDNITLKHIDGTNSVGNGAYTGSGLIYDCFAYVPANEVVELCYRITGYAADDNFNADLYMNVAVLTRGIDIQLRDGNSLITSLLPKTIQTWGDWSLVAGNDIDPTDTGAGNGTLASVRWTMERTFGGPFRIDASSANIADKQWIAFVVQDDLNAMDLHRFAIHRAEA